MYYLKYLYYFNFIVIENLKLYFKYYIRQLFYLVKCDILSVVSTTSIIIHVVVIM